MMLIEITKVKGSYTKDKVNVGDVLKIVTRGKGDRYRSANMTITNESTSQSLYSGYEGMAFLRQFSYLKIWDNWTVARKYLKWKGLNCDEFVREYMKEKRINKSNMQEE